MVTRRIGWRAHVPAPRVAEIVSAAEDYEWRTFADTAHMYPRARLADEWAPTVTPWCERVRPWPLGHDRGHIGRIRLTFRHLRAIARCQRCEHLQRLAHMHARRRSEEARHART